MADLVPFQFRTHEIRIHLGDDGEPLWIASDVGAVLEHTNIAVAMKRLDDDEKQLISVYTPGGAQDVWCINEAGLYNLILGSRKKEAKEFKRWITHTVLPTIRKTGSFQHSPLPQVKNPAHQMLIETIVRLDEVEQRALYAEQAAHTAELRATRAESKADIILGRYRMTIEQFVGAQGLLHQIPHSTFGAAARWLGDYCLQQNWDAPELPVDGRRWPTEKSYPIEALMRYVEYLRKRPQQITLVRPPGEEASHT